MGWDAMGCDGMGWDGIGWFARRSPVLACHMRTCTMHHAHTQAHASAPHAAWSYPCQTCGRTDGCFDIYTGEAGSDWLLVQPETCTFDLLPFARERILGGNLHAHHADSNEPGRVPSEWVKHIHRVKLVINGHKHCPIPNVLLHAVGYPVVPKSGEQAGLFRLDAKAENRQMLSLHRHGIAFAWLRALTRVPWLPPPSYRLNAAMREALVQRLTTGRWRGKHTLQVAPREQSWVGRVVEVALRHYWSEPSPAAAAGPQLLAELQHALKKHAAVMGRAQARQSVIRSECDHRVYSQITF